LERAINVRSDMPDEEAMIALICEGERAHFHELIRPYTRIMFAAAQAVLRNPADAEDAVQEAALKAFLHLPQLEDRRRFSRLALADCRQ